jgi:hypothetical protein
MYNTSNLTPYMRLAPHFIMPTEKLHLHKRAYRLTRFEAVPSKELDGWFGVKALYKCVNLNSEFEWRYGFNFLGEVENIVWIFKCNVNDSQIVGTGGKTPEESFDNAIKEIRNQLDDKERQIESLKREAVDLADAIDSAKYYILENGEA